MSEHSTIHQLISDSDLSKGMKTKALTKIEKMELDNPDKNKDDIFDWQATEVATAFVWDNKNGGLVFWRSVHISMLKTINRK